MLLHIYVQKIHFESAPSNAMACFLSIHSGSFEYCLSSVYYKGGTAFFDQVVHVPIQNDNDAATKVTLMGSIFMKNGLFEPQGKCTFITSPLEHGTSKQLSMFGNSGVILSQVVLTPSFYAAPMTDGVWTGSANPDRGLTGSFRREYEFLLARKKNWGQSRQSSWKEEHEALLAEGPERVKRDRVQRAEGGKNSQRVAWGEPKLRKTCMAVGYVHFWPSEKGAGTDEDKIMLKLHLAEQRRLKILRETEERACARNRACKKTSAHALQMRPRKEVDELKRILEERERELQQLRKCVSTHREFNSYHRTHSAVNPNIPTAIIGPKKDRLYQQTLKPFGGASKRSSFTNDSVLSGGRALPIKKSSKAKTKAHRAKKSAKTNGSTTRSSNKSKSDNQKEKMASRLRSRRDELKKVSTSAGSRVIKKILTRSQVLQRRLSDSWNADEGSKTIRIQLTDLPNLSSDSSSVDSVGTGVSTGLNTEDVNKSMSELRRSFREALDLTAKKGVQRISHEFKPDAAGRQFTRTVFIPTSSSLRMDGPCSESAIHNISDVNMTRDAVFISDSPRALRNKPEPSDTVRRVTSDNGDVVNSDKIIAVASAEQDEHNASIYQDLIQAMCLQASSDSDSTDISDYGKTLRIKEKSMTNHRNIKEVDANEMWNKTHSRSKRKSVLRASTESSRLKMKSSSAIFDGGEGRSRYSRSSKPLSINSPKKASKTSSSEGFFDAATKSSFLKLLASNSKDVSQEARYKYMLFGVDGVDESFDHDSTMAKLLATTPLASSRTQASQYTEEDIAADLPFQGALSPVQGSAIDVNFCTIKDSMDHSTDPTTGAAGDSAPIDVVTGRQQGGIVDYLSQINSVSSTVIELEVSSPLHIYIFLAIVSYIHVLILFVRFKEKIASYMNHGSHTVGDRLPESNAPATEHDLP